MILPLRPLASAPRPRGAARLALALTVLLGAAGLAGCPSGEVLGGAPAQAAVPGREPTLARLLERSAERAALTCAGEWIEVYDFLHPETQGALPIGRFLQGKDRHAYADPSAPELVARDGDVAYVCVNALWTPTIDIPVNNVPQGHDFTERIEWIETWGFADGDWHLRWPVQPPREFFEERPELLRKDEADDGTDAERPH